MQPLRRLYSMRCWFPRWNSVKHCILQSYGLFRWVVWPASCKQSLRKACFLRDLESGMALLQGQREGATIYLFQWGKKLLDMLLAQDSRSAIHSTTAVHRPCYPLLAWVNSEICKTDAWFLSRWASHCDVDLSSCRLLSKAVMEGFVGPGIVRNYSVSNGNRGVT